MGKTGAPQRAASAAESKAEGKQKPIRKSRFVLADTSNSQQASDASTETSKASSTVRVRRSTRLAKNDAAVAAAVQRPSRDNGAPAEKKPPRATRGRSKDTKPPAKGRNRSAAQATTTRGRSHSNKQSGKRKSRHQSNERPSKAVRRATDAADEQRVTRSRTKEERSLRANFVEGESYDMVVSSFDPTKYTLGLAAYDECNRDDPLEAPEYVTDIFQRLFRAENDTLIQPYITEQGEMTTAKRTILVDWLVEVHKKFRMVPDTLYLCVSIMDRYLSRVRVARKQLQLVGVTAMFIASKYEEIYPPEVKDCVYICDRAYTKQDILDMEIAILQELKFMISQPTAHPFLTRFLFITGASDTAKVAANYYLDRTLQEHDLLSFRPSLTAAAAVCLSLNNTSIRDHDVVDGEKPGVPQVLLKYTGYTKDEIYGCAKVVASKISEMRVTATNRSLVAVKKKYDNEHLHFVSTEFDPPSAEDLA